MFEFLSILIAIVSAASVAGAICSTIDDIISSRPVSYRTLGVIVLAFILTGILAERLTLDKQIDTYKKAIEQCSN